MLVLPAEAPDARLAGRFEDWNLDRFAVNSPVGALRLRCGNREQRAVVNRFDESIPQRVERRAQCPDVFRNRYVLLRLRNDSPVVNDGAADDLIRSVVDRHYGIHEGAALISMSDSQLGKLARSAAHRILMAFGTGPPIVDGAQSAVDVVQSLVDLLI